MRLFKRKSKLKTFSAKVLVELVDGSDFIGVVQHETTSEKEFALLMKEALERSAREGGAWDGARFVPAARIHSISCHDIHEVTE